MSLKPFTVLVAILAFCTSLMAQQKEPFLGIWELNHGKSHFTLREAPKINVTTRRIQLSPDGKTMTIESSGSGADRQDNIRVYEKRNPEAQ